MKKQHSAFGQKASRRSFLAKGAVAAGLAALGVGSLGVASRTLAREFDESGSLSRGDAAILRFLQALETIEADLWRQYAELGGPTAATGSLGLAGVDLQDPNGQ